MVYDSVTPRTVAHQAPLCMGFSRQEYWSGLPCPPPGDLPNPGIKHRSPALQVDSLPSEPPGKPIHLCVYIYIYIYVCMYRWTSPLRLVPALAFLLQLTAVSTIFISGAFMVRYLENWGFVIREQGVRVGRGRVWEAENEGVLWWGGWGGEKVWKGEGSSHPYPFLFGGHFLFSAGVLCCSSTRNDVEYQHHQGVCLMLWPQ